MNRAMILFALALPFATAPLAAKRAPRLPIEGVWKTQCLPIGKNGRHGFVTRLDVSGKMLTATTQIYAHNNCDMATVSTAYRGAIVATAPAADGAIDFDHIVGAITMTADAADVVTTYNASPASGCGLSGTWKLGVSQDVAGRFCAPWAFPVAGTRLYERAWVSGGELRIGSFPAVWNNVSADKRPTAPGLMIFRRQIGGKSE